MSLQAMPCTLREANDFVSAFHRHSRRTSRDGGRFAIAAVSAGETVAVAIVGNPLSATLMDGLTAEVLRTCIAPDAPKNCNSFLYAACRAAWFAMGGRKIITYTLLDESGASLRGAGWSLVAQIKGHNPASWGKKDGLRRTEQAITRLPKNRWECLNLRALDKRAGFARTSELLPMFQETA